MEIFFYSAQVYATLDQTCYEAGNADQTPLIPKMSSLRLSFDGGQL